MKTKPHFLYSFLFLFFHLFIYGQAVEVTGRIIEITDGVAKGISGVKISVSGESYDITGPDGKFTLFVSAGREYVKVTLENCPYPVVSPEGNKIYIPPFEPLKIQVCAAANKKLQEKIKKLDGQLDGLRRQRRHTARQLERMRQAMLDTIVFYEKQVRALQNEVAERDETISQKQKEIEGLEKKVEDLERQLFVALENKYLKQKEQFDAISGSLGEYIDQAKNLRDMLRPERVKQYFTANEGARKELYKVIENYNEARNAIVRDHEQQVVGVGNYWAEIGLADELESLFDFLLDEVHKEGIYPMEFSVNDKLKQYLTGNRSKSLRKSAEEGASEGFGKLAPLLEALEVRAERLIYRLKTEM